MIEDNNTELDKNKNFIDFCELSVDGETKEGMQIKGKDVLYLNAPKLYPSADTPLETNNKDIVGAINELKKDLDSGGGDDEPSYLDDPDYALYQSLPEPAENQIISLIRIYEDGATVYAAAGTSFANMNYYTEAYIDWGDGTETERFIIPKGTNSEKKAHTYAQKGDYIVTVTNNETVVNLSFSDINDNTSPSHFPTGISIAVKVGKNIKFDIGAGKIYCKFIKFYDGRIFDEDAVFADYLRLRHVDFNENDVIKPKILKKQKFSALPALDFTNIMPMLDEVEELIGNNFSGLYAIREINLPKLKKADNSFSQITCKEISLPSLEVGSNLFYNDYLEKLSLPLCNTLENCGIDCRNLKDIYIPKCTSIINSFISCLKLREIELPSCISVKSYSFRSDYALEMVIVAINCEIDENSFLDCYSLQPNKIIKQ